MLAYGLKVLTIESPGKCCPEEDHDHIPKQRLQNKYAEYIDAANHGDFENLGA
jgi:hypothetical protein